MRVFIPKQFNNKSLLENTYYNFKTPMLSTSITSKGDIIKHYLLLLYDRITLLLYYYMLWQLQVR